MITFKEFLSESHMADTKAKMLLVKTELAKALKLRRHEVDAFRRITDGDRGLLWMFRVPVREGMDPDFFLSMLRKLVTREVPKQFEQWKLEGSDLYPIEGTPFAVVQVYVPDADALLP